MFNYFTLLKINNNTVLNKNKYKVLIKMLLQYTDYTYIYKYVQNITVSIDYRHFIVFKLNKT